VNRRHDPKENIWLPQKYRAPAQNMNLAPIDTLFSRSFPCIQPQQSRGLMVRSNHNEIRQKDALRSFPKALSTKTEPRAMRLFKEKTRYEYSCSNYWWQTSKKIAQIRDLILEEEAPWPLGFVTALRLLYMGTGRGGSYWAGPCWFAILDQNSPFQSISSSLSSTINSYSEHD
jgi:hypothetical protein